MTLLTSSNMLLHLMVIFIGLYASTATGNHIGLNMCMQSKTVAVQILTGLTDDDLTCQCQASRLKLDSSVREDYTHTPGIGSHKLHTLAKPWNMARKICNEESGHLAIINSKAEEEVLLKMFRAEATNIREGANKEQAFLGIHDLYQEGEWSTIFGESLYSTGYAQWSTSWWGPQPDNKDNNQNCGALVLKGGLDDVHCHEKFAFFCELPLSCAQI